jgi:hypothetical protein
VGVPKVFTDEVEAALCLVLLSLKLRHGTKTPSAAPQVITSSTDIVDHHLAQR